MEFTSESIVGRRRGKQLGTEAVAFRTVDNVYGILLQLSIFV